MQAAKDQLDQAHRMSANHRKPAEPRSAPCINSTQTSKCFFLREGRQAERAVAGNGRLVDGTSCALFILVPHGTTSPPDCLHTAMHCPALVLWLLVGLVYHAQAQDSQDNQTAVPIWSQVSGSKFGTNNICNGTFADFNATGIFNFNPNKAGSNSLIRDTGLAFTIQSAPNTTSDPSNATSSSWGLWWNTDGANLTNKFSLGYDVSDYLYWEM